MSTWLAMGGYGWYVWGAYAAAAVLLGGLVGYVKRVTQHASRS